MTKRSLTLVAILLACLVAWAGAFAATHLPAPGVLGWWMVEQLLHLAGYFLLSVLFWLTLRAYGRDWQARLVWVFLIMAAYASFDELTQRVFGRWGDWGVWNANLLGTTLAFIICELAARFTRKRADLLE